MTLRIVLLALALPVLLGAQPARFSARFEVPFAFVGYDSDFPAGQYLISQIPETNLMKLQDIDRGKGLVLISVEVRRSLDRSESLLFEKHGDLYILREYRSGSLGAVKSLPLSKQRREVVKSYITRGFRPEPILISAVQ